MTAEATAGVAPDLAGLPSWTLDEAQLGDLELLLTGAFAPLTGFMTADEAQRVTGIGLLGDGTPWPVPVVLDVPGSAVPADARRLALLDPEGTPLAVLDIAGVTRLTSYVVALVGYYNAQFKQAGGKLVIAGAAPVARRSFELSGLAKVLNLADSTEAAVKELGG